MMLKHIGTGIYDAKNHTNKKDELSKKGLKYFLQYFYLIILLKKLGLTGYECVPDVEQNEFTYSIFLVKQKSKIV